MDVFLGHSVCNALMKKAEHVNLYIFACEKWEASLGADQNSADHCNVASV